MNNTDKPKKRGCLYWFRLLSIGLVGGFFLTFTGIEVVYIIVMARPMPSSICCTTPGDLGFEYQDITFSSDDDITLSGWHIPSHNGATIILLHGYGANRMELIRHIEILARHGYGVLVYDLRAHGQSGGKQRTYGWLDVQDVQSALDYLDRRGDVNMKRIGIFGFSVGGQIAIRAAAESNLIRAVFADDPGFVTVKDAPPSTVAWERLLYLVSWLDYKGMQLWTGAREPPGVAEVIDNISPRPLFLVATGGPGKRLVLHYYRLAGEPKTLWEIPEASHGRSLISRPQEYEEEMVAFFESNLPERKLGEEYGKKHYNRHHRLVRRTRPTKRLCPGLNEEIGRRFVSLPILESGRKRLAHHQFVLLRRLSIRGH